MNRIKELRLKKGLKQSELAKIVNIKQNTISNWENEVTEIDKNSLFALAEFFNVTTDYILGRTDNPAFQKEKTPALADEDLKFALFGDSEIDDDTLEDVRMYARIKREMNKQKRV